jgi:hypothetical protein
MAKKAKHLKEHQWKKGESGNPNGRPKKEFALNEHIRSFANLEGEDKKTMLEKVVETVYGEALAGNMTAVSFLADRILGKPQQSVSLKEESTEPIKIIDIGTDDAVED